MTSSQIPSDFSSRTRYSLTTVNSPERFDLTKRFWNVGSILAETPTMLEMVAVGAMATQFELRIPNRRILLRRLSQSRLAERSSSTCPPRSAANSAKVSCGRTP